MKKLIAALAIVVLLAGLAFAEPQPPVLQKMMEVRSDDGGLSENCTIVDGVAYYTIFGSIMGYEVRALWKDLKILKARHIKELVFYINSPGGAITDGFAFADLMRMAKKDGINITTEAHGMVASAAVPIFLMGDRRIAAEGVLFMVHKTKQFKYGFEDIESIEAGNKMMKACRENYTKLVADRTNLTVEEVTEYIKATTWFGSRQSLEWGFATEIK